MSKSMDFMNKNFNQEYEAGNDETLQDDLNYIANSEIPFKQFKNSTILVTGATGLIGASLIRALLCANRIKKLKLKVIAFARNREKAEKIFGNILERKDISLVIGDVNEKMHVTQNIDYIFHCACITASKHMISYPVETILTSVDGTKNVLFLAKEKKSKSVVYLSSMEIYGNIESDNVTEKELGYIDPLAVRSNYPESKRLCENMCIAFYTEYGVPVKIARLAQTFGAGILEDENRVFAQFARSAMTGKNIILHTKGKSEGNYCYLRDAIVGLLYIMVKGENGEAYNVSNPNTHISISAMAEMVCERIANGAINIRYEIPDDNSFGYAADTKMKLNSDKLQKTGWKPKVDLEEMYKRMIRSMEVNNE